MSLNDPRWGGQGGGDREDGNRGDDNRNDDQRGDRNRGGNQGPPDLEVRRQSLEDIYLDLVSEESR